MTATSGAADQTSQERLHVLIIEDNLRDAKLIVHELKRAGFNPEWVVVHSEEEYIARLENVPEIILADGSLPDFNAARALDLLRERNLTTPLIVVTGSLSDERAVEYMKHGAADYLLKDRLARLGQAVRHVIEKRRLTEEAQRVQEERNRYFSLSVDMICIAGFDGYFKLLNPAWEATLGWTTQELLDRPAKTGRTNGSPGRSHPTWPGKSSMEPFATRPNGSRSIKRSAAY
jgi:CheY-like chemotaxis protein